MSTSEPWSFSVPNKPLPSVSSSRNLLRESLRKKLRSNFVKSSTLRVLNSHSTSACGTGRAKHFLCDFGGDFDGLLLLAQDVARHLKPAAPDTMLTMLMLEDERHLKPATLMLSAVSSDDSSLDIECGLHGDNHDDEDSLTSADPIPPKDVVRERFVGDKSELLVLRTNEDGVNAPAYFFIGTSLNTAKLLLPARLGAHGEKTFELRRGRLGLFCDGAKSARSHMATQ